MLVLKRKTGQTIYIEEHIKITVLETGFGTVKIGIDAPDEVNIRRGEIEEYEHGIDMP